MSPNLLNHPPAAATTAQTDRKLSRLLEFVRLRAAQLLGCTEVIELHARQLLHLDENMGRIGQVYWWHESSLFTSRERTAFSLCEAMVVLEEIESAEPLITQARQDLTDEEVLGIVIAVNTVVDWKQMKTNAFEKRIAA